MSLQPLTLGRAMMAASQVFYSAGSFIADFSHTHVLNPRWPPHARFHNGQTMSLSLLLSTTSLCLLFRSRSISLLTQQVDDLFLAAWIGGLYMLAALSASWYPGTGWTDPEFRKVRDVDEQPQFWAFSGGLIVLWVGWGLETRRLGRQHRERKRI